MEQIKEYHVAKKNVEIFAIYKNMLYICTLEPKL